MVHKSLRILNDKFMSLIISVLAIILALGFIVTELVSYPLFEYIISGTILLLMLISLPQLRGATAIITYLLLGLGAILLIGNKEAVTIIIEGVRTNLTLITIFVVTPMLGITIRTSNYIEGLKVMLEKVKNNATFFYISTTFLTHILGFIINIGSVTINYFLTKASNVRSSRIIANALNRGFTTSIFWSPYFSAMALIISQLDIAWGKIGFHAFLFALLSMTVGYFIERPYIKEEEKYLLELEREKQTEDKQVLGSVKARKKVIELIILIFFMVISVLLLERFTSFNMVLSICIVSIFFPLIWCFLRREFKSYLNEMKHYTTKTIPNLRQEMTLFLSAGLFSAIFVQSPLSIIMIDYLNLWFGQSVILMTFALSSIIIITAIIGMHPIILVTILVTSVEPSLIGLSKENFALILLASWGLSNTISPTTAVNNILAKFFNENIMTVSLYWNWKYALFMMCLLPMYIYFINI